MLIALREDVGATQLSVQFDANGRANCRRRFSYGLSSKSEMRRLTVISAC
jgi:hypothetical protein